jgi:hypothetical protein
LITSSGKQRGGNWIKPVDGIWLEGNMNVIGMAVMKILWLGGRDLVKISEKWRIASNKILDALSNPFDYFSAILPLTSIDCAFQRPVVLGPVDWDHDLMCGLTNCHYSRVAEAHWLPEATVPK